jgi:hypothetical protein
LTFTISSEVGSGVRALGALGLFHVVRSVRIGAMAEKT